MGLTWGWFKSVTSKLVDSWVAFCSPPGPLPSLFNSCLRWVTFPKLWQVAEFVLFQTRPCEFPPHCSNPRFGQRNQKDGPSPLTVSMVSRELPFGFIPCADAVDAPTTPRSQRYIPQTLVCITLHAVSLDSRDPFKDMWWPPCRWKFPHPQELVTTDPQC